MAGSLKVFLEGSGVLNRQEYSFYIDGPPPEAVDMNGRFQMQGGKNWFLPKEMNANRFFWDSHWLEIWSNHFYPSMGPNGGSVAMDSGPLLYCTQEQYSSLMNPPIGSISGLLCERGRGGNATSLPIPLPS
jgi:hypothetical protein